MNLFRPGLALGICETGERFLLVEELIMSADLQHVLVHVQVIQIILSVTQGLIDQQIHRGRALWGERERERSDVKS